MAAPKKSSKQDRMLTALKKIFLSRQRLPTLNDFASQLLNEFGGAERFAKRIFEHYAHDKTSQQTKTHIIKEVLRMLNKAREQEVAQPDISGLSDDELYDAAQAVIAYANKFSPDSIDGPSSGTGGHVAAGPAGAGTDSRPGPDGAAGEPAVERPGRDEAGVLGASDPQSGGAQPV